MGFDDLQYFFYVFYRPLLFSFLLVLIVVQLILAMFTMLKELVLDQIEGR